jgi:hypothetical protein
MLDQLPRDPRRVKKFQFECINKSQEEDDKHDKHEFLFGPIFSVMRVIWEALPLIFTTLVGQSQIPIDTNHL